MNSKVKIIIWLILLIHRFSGAEGYLSSGAYCALDNQTMEKVPGVWYLAGWDGYNSMSEEIALFGESIHQGTYNFDTGDFKTFTGLTGEFSYRKENFLFLWSIEPELSTYTNFSDYLFQLNSNILLSFGNDHFTLEIIPQGGWYKNHSRKTGDAQAAIITRFAIGNSWLLSPFLSGGSDFISNTNSEPFMVVGTEFNWYPLSWLSLEGVGAFKNIISTNNEYIQLEDSIIQVSGYYGYKEISCNLNLIIMITELLSLELEIPAAYRKSDSTVLSGGEKIILWQFIIKPELVLNFRFSENFSLSLIPRGDFTLSNDLFIQENQINLEIGANYLLSNSRDK